MRQISETGECGWAQTHSQTPSSKEPATFKHSFKTPPEGMACSGSVPPPPGFWTSFSPVDLYLLHTAPRTQPVCLNITLGVAHFGFGHEAILHATGNMPTYPGRIGENGHHHPSGHQMEKNGLVEMEEA